jgi:DNA repair protein RadA/Sms
MRSNRLNAQEHDLELAATTNTDDIVATIQTGKHKVVIVDSIQTIAYSGLSSNPGSVSQITTNAHLLNEAAKKTDTTLIIVGHVTKDGAIAGPKVLEHLVDVVLNLEGDRQSSFKVLRSVKNRFGSTQDVALFEMQQTGMVEVSNPSEALLQQRRAIDGSVVLATLEGTRPLLVEVQALVTKSQFGYPKRAASGFDLNRLNLLIAVLSRRTKLALSDKDIYINIVGGIKVADSAADAAVCMAIASAALKTQLHKDVVVFGEIGLGGELRHAQMSDQRIKEALKLGFSGAIGPKTSAQKGLNGVDNIADAIAKYLK